MKNSSDTIGNRTRDLPACRAVPQPTASPRDHADSTEITYPAVSLFHAANGPQRVAVSRA